MWVSEYVERSSSFSKRKNKISLYVRCIIYVGLKRNAMRTFQNWYIQNSTAVFRTCPKIADSHILDNNNYKKLQSTLIYTFTCRPLQEYTKKVKGKVVPVINRLCTTPWRRMGEWMYRYTHFWRRHYLEASGQLHTPADLPPMPRTGLDDVKKIKILHLLELELGPFGRPARSQSLYGLRYPGCR
jgi:hypothetical protein